MALKFDLPEKSSFSAAYISPIPFRKKTSPSFENENATALQVLGAIAEGTWNDQSIQKAFASTLRQMAIRELKEGTSQTARGFRGEYSATHPGQHYEAFLHRQSSNGAWGTYIELAALGELFNCDVVVTTVKDGVEQATFGVHRASAPEKPKPLIHLYNSNNTHWFCSKTSSTLGDGNCLYNAFAQALLALKRPFVAPLTFPHQPLSASPVTLFSKKPVLSESFLKQKALEQQGQEWEKLAARWREAIQKVPTPQERASMAEAERRRIAALPREEQQQIKNDHAFALNLAMEESRTLNRVSR